MPRLITIRPEVDRRIDASMDSNDGGQRDGSHGRQIVLKLSNDPDWEATLESRLCAGVLARRWLPACAQAMLETAARIWAASSSRRSSERVRYWPSANCIASNCC